MAELMRSRSSGEHVNLGGSEHGFKTHSCFLLSLCFPRARLAAVAERGCEGIKTMGVSTVASGVGPQECGSSCWHRASSTHNHSYRFSRVSFSHSLSPSLCVSLCLPVTVMFPSFCISTKLSLLLILALMWVWVWVFEWGSFIGGLHVL